MKQLNYELLPFAMIHLIVHIIPFTLVSWLILEIGGLNDILLICFSGLFLTILVLILEILGGHVLVTSLFKIRWISHENDAIVYSMVKGLAKKSEVDIEKIGIIELEAPNAFVVSSFRGKPILFFTRGLIYNLNFSELQAITFYLLGCAQHELLPIVTILSGLQSIGIRLSAGYIESSINKQRAGILKTIIAGWGYLLFSAFNTQTVKCGRLLIYESEAKINESLDNASAMVTGLLKISYLLENQRESYMRTGLISLKALMFQDPSIAVKDRMVLREILNRYDIKIEKLLNNKRVKVVNNSEIKFYIFEKYFIHEGIKDRINKIIESKMNNGSAMNFGFNKVA